MNWSVAGIGAKAYEGAAMRRIASEIGSEMGHLVNNVLSVFLDQHAELTSPHATKPSHHFAQMARFEVAEADHGTKTPHHGGGNSGRGPSGIA